MDGQIVAIYCLCDDLTKAMRVCEDPQCRMSNAEVMTTAIVAALHFGANLARARVWLRDTGFIPAMLSESRFVRRLGAVQDLLAALFLTLGAAFKRLNAPMTYAFDSFPVPACDNIRIREAKIYQGKVHRGYCKAKRRYFYGMKLFLLTTAKGEPVEAFLMPGSTGDVTAYSAFAFDLPSHSVAYGDSAFTLYEQEEAARDGANIHLMPMRRCNSTRPYPPWVAYLQARGRKIIETAGSQIDRLMPRTIHAVASQGFEIKIMLFVLAYAITFIV